MNALERVLYDELTYLLDRVATAVPEGSGPAAISQPLRTRLDDADAALAAAHAEVLAAYGRWNRALEDVENLWSLAAWHSAGAEEPREQPAPLAA